MTDSMNFGPEWLRNLSSEGTTTGIGGGGSRCQLADYRYGREDMLALYEKGLLPPYSLTKFPPIYSEQVLSPLALVPPTEEERQWAARAPSLGPSTRGGRGAPGIGERGGRGVRGGRGAYQPFGRALGGAYESGSGGSGWGSTGEQPEWSPRKDFTYTRSTSSSGFDNWRRNNRTLGEDEDGWRTTGSHGRGGGPGEKWARSSSWREGEEETREKRWLESNSGATRGGGGGHRRVWDAQDEHLPEWATENLAEGGGTFDSSGAFHGSDDEHDREKGKELQKSTSQHNIRNQHIPLVTSKSAVALSISKNSKPDVKPELEPRKFQPESGGAPVETVVKERSLSSYEREMLQLNSELGHREPSQPADEPSKPQTAPAALPPAAVPSLSNSNQSNNTPLAVEENVVEEDFEKLQEDFVSKLVVDEEPPKSAAPSAVNLPSVGLSNGIPAPPPNLIPPSATQEKWFYQDPQGDMQGPFSSAQMEEWFKAGYFSTTLFVRRQHEERFYTLGELVNLSNGNPFITPVPMPPSKQENFTDPEIPLHYQPQFMQAPILRARNFGSTEHWAGMPGFQHDMYTPSVMPPMGHDILPPSSAPAPMMHHMLNQYKLPQVSAQPPVLDEPLATPNSMHNPIRSFVQQMGGLQTLQSRLQQQIMPPPTTHSMPSNGTVPAPQKQDASKIEPTDFIQFMQQHAALGKQATQQIEQRIDLDSLWKRTQFQQAQQQPQIQVANNLQTTAQWAQSDKPISMWDAPTKSAVTSLQQQDVQAGMPPSSQSLMNQVPDSPINNTSDKKNKKEEKKQKELEEKQVRKEAEEKRKQEQRKQETEKKQQEEKRRKEDERIRKELERAKKEADEKRLKELAEKKRQKELRKEEEARKKAADELKKQEEEKERQVAIEREEVKKQQTVEAQRQVALAAASQKPIKTAPWSQATNNQGLSLAEIQKIERERKAEQVLMLQQQQHRQMQQAMQEQVASPEKMNTFGVPLNWANKPIRPNHVKSLAEIQAEEQDRMLKQKEKEKAAQKEKETLSPPTSTIWCGQSLTWSNSDSPGFWDEPVNQPQPPQQKKSQVQPVKQAATRQQQPQQQSAKKQAAKQQKEQANNNANSNNSEVNSSDEFTNWCIRTLANMNTQVDIPTFVSFLRTIESALDVRDYCRDYLGDKPATQQFAAQFLERRRSFKPRPNAHKDDMCSPAPAITPSSQHNSDFQEVKGKGKKVKKSKMLKVDARILGFSVTAAQDRINVGDRDYGES